MVCKNNYQGTAWEFRAVPLLFCCTVRCDHVQKISGVLRKVAVLLPGGYEDIFDPGSADGEADGAAGGPAFQKMVVAFRGKCSSEALHGQTDGHLTVAGVHQDMRDHVVVPEKLQSKTSGILIGVEKDKIFIGQQSEIDPWVGKSRLFDGLLNQGIGRRENQHDLFPGQLLEGQIFRKFPNIIKGQIHAGVGDGLLRNEIDFLHQIDIDVGVFLVERGQDRADDAVAQHNGDGDV